MRSQRHNKNITCGDNVNDINDDDNVQVADFIREVEISAKKILRDDKRNRNKKVSSSTSASYRSYGSGCGGGSNNNFCKSSSKTTTSPLIRKHVNWKGKDDFLDEEEKGNSNNTKYLHETLHRKLKDSPFYESWEEWNKSKRNTISANNNNTNTMEDHGLFAKRIMGGNKSINSNVSHRIKPLKKYKESSSCETDERFDMKTQLHANALRKRYRCDQALMDVKSDDNDAETDDKAGDDKVTQSHNKESSGHGQIQSNDPVKVQAHHPLYESLLNHINAVSGRIRLMAKKRFEARVQIKDVHECWMVNAEGLSRSSNVQNETIEVDGDDKMSFNRKQVDPKLLGETTQIQSVSLGQATQAFRSHCITKVDSSSSCIMSPANVSTSNNYYNYLPIVKITPESWPLIVFEEISYKRFKVSIHLMRGRSAEHDDNNIHEYWVIDIYDISYKLKKRLVLLYKEVKSITKDYHVLRSVSFLKREKIVHRQEITKDVGEMTLTGQYFVGIHVNEDRTITASFTIKFENIESHYGFASVEPYKADCPVYEIIIRLHKHNICKAFDYDFWSSENNGELIWSPLLDLMKFKFVKKKVWDK